MTSQTYFRATQLQGISIENAGLHKACLYDDCCMDTSGLCYGEAGKERHCVWETPRSAGIRCPNLLLQPSASGVQRIICSQICLQGVRCKMPLPTGEISDCTNGSVLVRKCHVKPNMESIHYSVGLHCVT